MSNHGEPSGPTGRVILVLGMHRSGTSLLAHMLAATGVPFGTDLLNEPRPDNPKGYGEHAGVVAIHEALLATLGRVWHGPDGTLPLPPDWMSWPETVAARAELAAIVTREVGGGWLWAVKDPRLSRLLPLWRALLQDLGLVPVPLLCLRHPGAVAASLAMRNHMAVPHATAIWAVHQHDVLTALDQPPSIVDYDALLAAPERVLRRALDALGVAAMPEALARAVALADPVHRHHGVQDPHPTPPGDAEALYAALRARALGGTEETAGPPPALPSAPASMPAGPSVDIIMRTRDRAAFLPRAIRSVLGQTHRAWTLTIVNDGGRAEAVEAVVAPYRLALGTRLRLLHLDPSRGMEAASNYAIGQGTAEFIVVHDDDDSWRPRFLEAALAELARTGQQGVVTGTVLVQERTMEQGPVENMREPFRPEMLAISLPEMMVGNQFPPIAFLYRRSAWEEVGPYREDLPVLGDWEFNLRFLSRHPIGYLPEALAHWHRRPADDTCPNSDPGLHRRTDVQMRDVLARGSGTAPALIAGLAPILGRLARETVADITAQLNGAIRRATVAATALPHQAGSAPVHLRLVPTWHHLVQPQDGEPEAYVSMGTDPQLYYEVPGPPLPPGSYHVSVPLAVPPDSGPVELFFSATRNHTQERGIVLEPNEQGAFAGVFSTDRPIRHLRLDPLTWPGRFRVGALALRHAVVARGAGRLPDFLGIGAQRSGTTWLHCNLAAHPGVHVPQVKELHYFDDAAGIDSERWARLRLRHLAHAQAEVLASPAGRESEAWRRLDWAGRFATARYVDAAWYASLFAEAPPSAMAGEITPAYAVLPERAVAEVARLIPGLRVLFLMRDPIVRSISGAIHELTTATGVTTPPTVEAIARELERPRCRERSAYRATIERWERHLVPGALGCFLFDDVRDDPSGLLNRVCDFLGVARVGCAAPEIASPANANPTRAAKLPASLLRCLAERHVEDLRWLADRFGGATLGWRERAEQMLAPHTPRPDRTGDATAGAIGLGLVLQEAAPYANGGAGSSLASPGDGEAAADAAHRARIRHLSMTLARGLTGAASPRVLDLASVVGLGASDFAAEGADAATLVPCAAADDRRTADPRPLAGTAKRLRQAARQLPSGRAGRFDVVICLGCLSDATEEDLTQQLVLVGASTAGVALLDLRLAREATDRMIWQGEEYDGQRIPAANVGRASPDQAGWEVEASSRRDRFRLTRAALCRLLARVGLPSIIELRATTTAATADEPVILLAMTASDDMGCRQKDGCRTL